MNHVTFDKALTFVLKYEGAYSNNLADNGGATMCGITSRTYETWCATNNKPIKPIRQITMDEVKVIYFTNYWIASGARQIDDAGYPKVATALMDYAVNAGPTQAVRSLQKVLDVEADGVVGPVTIGAIESYISVNSEEQLVESYLDKRLEFYQSIVRHNPSQNTFIKGWVNRVNALDTLLTD